MKDRSILPHPNSDPCYLGVQYVSDGGTEMLSIKTFRICYTWVGTG